MIQAATFIGIGLAIIGFAFEQLEVDADIYFPLVALMMAISAIFKILSLLVTRCGGSLQLTPSTLSALVFVFMFTIGGLSGVALANSSLHVVLNNTFYLIFHSNYALSISVILLWFVLLNLFYLSLGLNFITTLCDIYPLIVNIMYLLLFFYFLYCF